MKDRSKRPMAMAGLAAGSLFALALVLFAAPLPNYRHAQHPPAVLGAIGYPGSVAWNVLGYVVVGGLAVLAGHALYLALREDRAGMTARIGATLMLLAGVAFVAQGVFPLDLQQAIDIGPSGRHIAVWNLWWIAVVAGAVVTALGVHGMPRWRSLTVAGLLAAAMVVGALHTDIGGIGPGWRQRIALAAWFVWLAWGSLLVLRRAPR